MKWKLPATVCIASFLVVAYPRPEARQDDTQSLKAMFTKGGVVNLQAGKTYSISGPLTIGPNTNISCRRGEATIKVASDFPAGTAITMNGAQGSSISNVVFDGGNAPKLTTLFLIFHSTGVTVSRCKFRNTVDPSSNLLAMRDAHQVNVSDSEFTDSIGAVFLYLTNSEITVSNNQIHGVHNYGIRLQGSQTESSSHVDIIGNRVSDMQRFPGKTAGHEIYVNIGQDVPNKHQYITVKGNQLEGLGKGWANLGNGDLCEYQDVEHGVVEGNTVEKGGDVGIAIVRSDSVVVQDNHCGYNNTNGIAIVDSSNCTVFGNTVYDNDQNRDSVWTDVQHKGGIRVMTFKAPADNNRIYSNHIYDDQGTSATQDYGICIQGNSRNTEIGSNDIHDNRLGDVKDEGISTHRTGSS